MLKSSHVYRSKTYLIFVTKFINEKCGDKSVMWRNIRFLYMADVENSEITLHVEKFLQNTDLCAIYAVLSRLVLFCVEKILDQNCICG